MKLKLLILIGYSLLQGCASFNGFKGSATAMHEKSGISVTVGYQK